MPTVNFGPCECCGSGSSSSSGSVSQSGGGCLACQFPEDIVEINAPCLGLVGAVPGHACAPMTQQDGWIVPSILPTCGGVDFMELEIECIDGVFECRWEIVKDAVSCDFGTAIGTVNSLHPRDIDFEFNPDAECCPCGDNTVTVSILE